MRRLVLKMSVSVDGFVAGPNGEVDWIFRSFDAEAVDWVVRTLWDAGMHLMGHRTFLDMSAWWPSSTEPFAAPMNEIPKATFSHGRSNRPASTSTALRDAAEARGGHGAVHARAAELASRWRETPVLTGPLGEEIANLKQQPGGNLLAHGGASFANSLVAAGLVDEYRLLVHPVVLGSGLSLFGGLEAPRHLELLESRAFAGGTVANVYRPRPTP